jgi:acetyl-CoA carboxylase biotin carboxyl carrier protein
MRKTPEKETPAVAPNSKVKQELLGLADIQKLIEVLGKSSLDELELEMGGSRLKLSKHPPQVPNAPVVAPASQPVFQTFAVPHTSMAPGPAPEAAKAAPSGPGPIPESADLLLPRVSPAPGSVELKSPMVGTFYRSPAPGADPFVKIGDRVKSGQTLCIIEAMKLFNEIEAETDGVLIDILVENAQPVEYGECLMLIQPGA